MLEGEQSMPIKRFTEQELLEDLTTKTSHVEDLAKPLAQELEPLSKLRGSVKRYLRPMDGVWDDFLDDEDDSQTKHLKN